MKVLLPPPINTFCLTFYFSDSFILFLSRHKKCKTIRSAFSNNPIDRSSAISEPSRVTTDWFLIFTSPIFTFFFNWFPFNNFKYYFTLFSKFISSFPHGTFSLSVSNHYLALDGVYHPFCTVLSNNATRWNKICSFNMSW